MLQSMVLWLLMVLLLLLVCDVVVVAVGVVTGLHRRGKGGKLFGLGSQNCCEPDKQTNRQSKKRQIRGNPRPDVVVAVIATMIIDDSFVVSIDLPGVFATMRWMRYVVVVVDVDVDCGDVDVGGEVQRWRW